MVVFISGRTNHRALKKPPIPLFSKYNLGITGVIYTIQTMCKPILSGKRTTCHCSPKVWARSWSWNSTHFTHGLRALRDMTIQWFVLGKHGCGSFAQDRYWLAQSCFFWQSCRHREEYSMSTFRYFVQRAHMWLCICLCMCRFGHKVGTKQYIYNFVFKLGAKISKKYPFFWWRLHAYETSWTLIVEICSKRPKLG